MAKKKNRFETVEADAVGEPASVAAAEAMGPPPEEPFVGPPAPEALRPSEPAAPVAEPPSPAPSESPAEPVLAPNSDGPSFIPQAPLAQPALAPVAVPVPDSLGSLEERIDRLERALANLQRPEQITTQPARETPAATVPTSASIIEKANHLLDAGKHLLPGLASAAPAARAATSAGKVWMLWESLAEARAILRMYTDPRYSMSWSGRFVPILLLIAFLTATWWVPFAAVPIFGWIVAKIVEVVLAFVLFKVLGHEARRYRETAPDLPPSLRL